MFKVLFKPAISNSLKEVMIWRYISPTVLTSDIVLTVYNYVSQ
jgi:hypothetical protein